MHKATSHNGVYMHLVKNGRHDSATTKNLNKEKQKIVVQ